MSSTSNRQFMKPFIKTIFVFCLVLLIASVEVYSQSIGQPGLGNKGPNPLKNVYFGEEHIHTSNSPDAFMVGTRGSWEDAYNWAMGKEITLSTTGEKIKKLYVFKPSGLI